MKIAEFLKTRSLKPTFVKILEILKKRKVHTAIGGTVILLIILAAYLFYFNAEKKNSVGVWATVNDVVVDTSSQNAESDCGGKVCDGDAVNTHVSQTVEFKFSENVRPINQPLDVSFETLKQITQTVSKDNHIAKIYPAAKGKWMWIKDDILKFTPTRILLPDTEYSVVFNEKIFREATVLVVKQAAHRPNVIFKTEPLLVKISEMRFYENPVSLKEKKIVATLTFNYPISRESLEKKLSLELGKKPLSFEVKYDASDTVAYIHSAFIQIKGEEDWVNLTVGNVKDDREQVKIEKTVSKSVRIPSSDDYFKISKVNAEIFRNPQNNNEPEQILSVVFTAPVKVSHVAGRVSAEILEDYCYSYRDLKDTQKEQVKKKSLTLTPVATNEEFSKVVSFKFDEQVATKRCLRALVSKGLVSQEGFIMSKSYENLFSVPEYPRELKIAFDGAILSQAGAKELTFLSRGIEAIDAKVYRINSRNINNLISQTSGDLKKANFSNYKFNENNISELFEEKIQLAKLHPAKANYSSINLSKYFEDKKGLFIVELNSADGHVSRESEYEYEERCDTYGYCWTEETFAPKKRRLIMVTDLGLLVKRDKNGGSTVFVSSIKNGVPLSGVMVQMLGLNGLANVSKTSDATGHVSFSATQMEENGPKKPVAFIAQYHEDISFIPIDRSSNMLDFTKFEIDGRYEGTSENQILTHVFTDRDLYRPGETINFATIVRLSNFSVPAGIPLEIVLINPLGKEINVKQEAVSKDGFIEFNVDTRPEYPTGIYNFYVYLVKDNRRDEYLGSKAVRVEEFMPDTMKINLQLEEEKPLGWVRKGIIKSEITLSNLFGAPAQERRVRQNFVLEPSNFSFKEYKDYLFTDPLRNEGAALKSVNDESSEETTDESGKAAFKIDLSTYTKGTYKLSLYTEGFEARGGRSVVAQKAILVSPLDYIVGSKADGDLNYINKESRRSVDFIAIDSNAERVATKLAAVLFERKNIATLIERPDGTFKYQTVVKEEVISEAPVVITAVDSLHFDLDTRRAGSFVLKLKNSEGDWVSKIDYAVVGESNLNFSIDKDAELDLKLNKTQYTAGETIEMQIAAPYTGYGLITIEREKVFAFKWFKSSSKNFIQTITLPEGVEGNAYINVAFIRDIDSKEIFVSPLSYAVRPFSINQDKFNNKISLNVPERVKPGDTLNIKYKAEKPTSLILYGVDEGILQVAKYKLPQPLKTFFAKAALQVKTSQIMDMILPEIRIVRELMAIGGDEGAEMLARNLNPFARKDYKPVVFWSGVIQADSEEQIYPYLVPDYFNGQLTVMAVASSGAGVLTVGSAETMTQVRGDFILSPSYPTIVAPGDEFEIGLSVSNQLDGSGKKAKISIKAVANEFFEMLGDKTSTIEVDEGSEKTVLFRAKAKNALGAGSITFTAGSAEKIASVKPVNTSVSISVRPAVPYENDVVSGFDKKKIKIENFALDLFKAYRKQELSVSTSPLIITGGLLEYLEQFPFACTEQITSKAFAATVLAKANPAVFAGKRTDELFQTTIDILRARQTSNGGFTAWDNGDTDNADHSVFVIHFLTEAKRLGYSVPNSLLSGGIGWLKSFVNETPGSLEEARLTAYGIYILTLNETVTTNYILNLEKYLSENQDKLWQKDITGAYVAAAYKIILENRKADALIKNYSKENKGYYSDYDTPSIRDAKYYYLLSKHFPEQAEKIKEEMLNTLMVPLKTKSNTQLASNSILALYTLTENKSGDIMLSFKEKTKDGKEKKEEKLHDGFAVNYEFDDSTKSIEVTAKEPLYYNIVQQGFNSVIPEKAKKAGVELFREYLDADGNSVTSAQVGQELTIRIRVRSFDARKTYNMVVIDLMPGGFEVVQESLEALGRFDNAEIREDRMLLFMAVGETTQEITFRVKVTARGTFTIPPIYATSLYDTSISAMTPNYEKFVVE